MTKTAEQPSTTTPFEPAKHLTRVGGSDYLEVKWRLVWMRDQHPDATIETQLVDHDFAAGNDSYAVFKALVSIPGGGSATGWGQETSGDFRDYMEKAETKAIGRALAALGFGTQFCPDHDFGGAVGRVVDSPVKAPRGNPQQSERPAAANRASAAPRVDPVEASISDQPATQRQLRYLSAVAREAGVDAVDLDERCKTEFGKPAAALGRREASTMIDVLQSRSNSGYDG